MKRNFLSYLKQIIVLMVSSSVLFIAQDSAAGFYQGHVEKINGANGDSLDIRQTNTDTVFTAKRPNNVNSVRVGDSVEFDVGKSGVANLKKVDRPSPPD